MQGRSGDGTVRIVNQAPLGIARAACGIAADGDPRKSAAARFSFLSRGAGRN